MYIKFIKEHPSGFMVDAGLNTSEVLGSRLVKEGYAEKVDKKAFDKLESNGVIVANKIAAAKEEALKKECEDCSENEECEDCKSSKE